MDTAKLREIKFFRYFYTELLMILMFLMAEFSGHSEIIFPEILAILTGCWISKKQPWNTNKLRILLLTTFAAALGVFWVKFISVSLFIKVLISFIVSGLLLIIFKTNFIPIIPAGIFPIFMNVETLIYPIAVGIMSFLIILGQSLLEKYHYRHKDKYMPQKFNQQIALKMWIKLIVVFSVISAAPLISGYIFLISPPVIVTFTDLSNPLSMNRKRALKIFCIMFFASFIGSLFRLILSIHLNLPLLLAAICASVILFITFNKTKVIYPPACGALLMPMILKSEQVIWYPIEVAIGLILLIPIALHLFKQKS